jgi:hypothetical protein
MDQPLLAAALQELLDACPPLSSCPGLPTLTPGADCRGPVQDPLSILLRLQRNFDEPTLVRAGLVEKHDAAGFILAHALYEPDSLIVGLRRQSAGAPFDLLTPGGTVSGRLAILSSLKDGVTKKAFRREPFLLACNTIQEVVFLRTLGMAATLSADLLKCRNFGQLKKVADFFSDEDVNDQEDVPAPRCDPTWIPRSVISAPTDNSESAATNNTAEPMQRPALVLVGWDIVKQSVSIPPEIPTLLGHLGEVEDRLALEFEVRIWLPSSTLLKDLAFVTQFNSKKSLRTLLVASIEGECQFSYESKAFHRNGDADSPAEARVDSPGPGEGMDSPVSS